MKVRIRDGKRERKILTAAIVNKDVAARLAASWQDEMFASPHANTIGKWCVDHYREFGDAPREAIEGIFENWREGADEKTSDLISDLLEVVSDEYERGDEINAPYVISVAEDLFNTIKCRRLVDSIQGHVDTGDTKGALSAITDFNHTKMTGATGIDVLLDEEAIRSAFETTSESILEYPSSMRRFFKGQLTRDAFIAFLGPEKRGKTWWLIDAAWRGMLQRRRVAFFAIGDMSESQILRRFMIRCAKYPGRRCDYKIPKKLHVVFDEDEGAIVDVEADDRVCERGLTWKRAVRASRKLQKVRVKSKESYLKLITEAADTMSVEDITAQLRNWEYEGWTPDIIVIDYADLLAMPYRMDRRDQINKTWAHLRALSQIYHCLVVTATQADAASVNTPILTRRNFSEDKRKLAHVTGMIGINQTDYEKQLGVMRLNWIALREAGYSETECLYLAGCMEIGNPAILGRFPHKSR